MEIESKTKNEEVINILDEFYKACKIKDIEAMDKLTERLRKTTGTTKFGFLDCQFLPPERNEEGFRVARTEVILLDNRDLNHSGVVFLRENSTKVLDFIHITKGDYLARMGHIVVFTNTYTGAQKMLKCRYA